MSTVSDAPAADVPVHAHRLVRDVLIYGAGGIGLQLLLSVTVPIFTRIFTPADYGVIETTTTLVVVLALAASLGLESASQRSYFDYRPDEQGPRRAVLSTTFFVLFATSGLLGACVAGLAPQLSDLLFGSDRYRVALALAAATLPVAILANFFREIMRLRGQPGRYSSVAVLGGVTSIGLALYLAGARDEGLSGYYLGLLLGGIVGCLAGYALVRGAIGFLFDRAELRVMLAYGLPLVPTAASVWVLQFVDRFFLLHFSSLQDLGLYGVGARLAGLLLLVVTAFTLAWSPFMFDLHQRDPAGERASRGRVLTTFVLVLCFGALCLSAFANEILRIFTPASYEDAYQVVGLLAGSVVAIGINAVTMTEISLQRRTLYFARYTLYAAVLNVALNFLLIPPWGMIGAALATFLSYAALAALYYWRAQRLGPAPFELGRLLIVVVVTGALVAVGTLVHLDPLWLSVAVKLPLLAAFPLSLRLLGVLEAGWLANLVTWVRVFVRQGMRPAFTA